MNKIHDRGHYSLPWILYVFFIAQFELTSMSWPLALSNNGNVTIL